jgi:predicted metal-dependent hydrolase
MTPEEEKIHLEQKIEQVKQDLERFRQGDNADSKLEYMMFYQDYLQDELKILQKKLKNTHGI